MFAPPSLVASLALLSPQVRALPEAVRRRIAQAGDVPGPGRYRVVGVTTVLNVRDAASTAARINATVKNGALGTSDGTVDNGFAYIIYDTGESGWSSVQYLAPEGLAPVAAAPAAAPGGAAPQGPDLVPGEYVVATAQDPLNLRASPSTAAAVVFALPKGAHVIASGLNQNYFAQVQHEGIHTGWAASHYLVPASQAVLGGGLVLSGADLLQLRTMLAAWASATAGAPAYGSASDLAMTTAAAGRQAEVLAAFQVWNNSNRGTALRTDGVVDQASRDALIAWGAAAVGIATPTGPAAPLGGGGGGGGGEPSGGGGDVVSQAKAGGTFALLAIGMLAVFYVLEEKRRKRTAAA